MEKCEKCKKPIAEANSIGFIEGKVYCDKCYTSVLNERQNK